jgi:hypothetical protein
LVCQEILIFYWFVLDKILLVPALATHSRQCTDLLPKSKSKHQNILLYYTSTMSSTTPKSLSLSKEDRMQIFLQLLEANPNLSGRELAKIYNLSPSSLYHRRNSRQLSKEYHQKLQKLSVIEESSLVKWVNTIGAWGWPPQIQHLESIAKSILTAKKCPPELSQHWYKNFLA